MAQEALSIPSLKLSPTTEAKSRTYWQMVLGKLWADKLTVFALALMIFVVSITLGAKWIGDNVLGFDPTKTSLRDRNDAPTWAVDSWPTFQDFSRTCQSDEGCNWALWGVIFGDSAAGIRACLAADIGTCHWLGTDDAGRDVMTRAVYGGRISLRIGVFVATISMTLGIVLGLISGYYAATWIDDLINAVIMTLGSIPLLFLLIILSSIFSPSPEGLAFLLGIFAGWASRSSFEGKSFPSVSGNTSSLVEP